jgi:O-antigen ligase
MVAQSIMTFSRGGVIGGLVCCFFLGILSLRDRRRRWAFFIVGFLIAAGIFFVFPKLNEFTKGKLSERYEKLDTTNRWQIMLLDLDTFIENPVIGVGVGFSSFIRQKLTGVRTAAHTEFTRLLAEHGILGLGANLILLFWILRNLWRARDDPWSCGIILGIVAWSVFFMSHAAMRIAAPSILIGLSSASFENFNKFILLKYNLYKIGNKKVLAECNYGV